MRKACFLGQKIQELHEKYIIVINKESCNPKGLQLLYIFCLKN